MFNPGSRLQSRGPFIFNNFLYLFCLLDTLGVKSALGGISAFTAKLTKMAAEISVPAGSIERSI